MKKQLLFILPLVLALSGCESLQGLQPMLAKAGDSIDKIFGSPEAGTQPAAGTVPRDSYDQTAVSCNQEASRPYSNVDFNFCMRTRGYEVLPPHAAN